MSLLLNLPTDCLIEVYSKWLDVDDIVNFISAITNKSIRDVVLSILRLNYCILSRYSWKSYSTYHQWLIHNGLHVNELAIALLPGKSLNDATDIVLSQQQTVRRLNLYICNDSGPLCATLVTECVSLTCLLVVDNTSTANSTVTSIIQALPELNKMMKLSLTLEEEGACYNTLVLVAKTFMNLEELYLNFCMVENVIHSDDVMFPSLQKFYYYDRTNQCGWIVRGAPLLKHLDYFVHSITASDLEFMLEKSKNLEYLDIDTVERLDASYLSKVVSNNKQLQTMSIDSTTNIDFIIHAIIANCPDFKEIFVSNGSASESVLISFVTALPGLNSIVLKSNNRLTSRFINSLVSSCVSITIIWLENEPLLTDDDVTKICRFCPNLKQLSFYNSTLLSDKALLSITALCNNLEELYIYIGNMTAEGLHCLTIGCPVLNKVRLHGFKVALHGDKIEYLRSMKPECSYYAITE